MNIETRKRLIELAGHGWSQPEDGVVFCINTTVDDKNGVPVDFWRRYTTDPVEVVEDAFFAIEFDDRSTSVVAYNGPTQRMIELEVSSNPHMRKEIEPIIECGRIINHDRWHYSRMESWQIYKSKNLRKALSLPESVNDNHALLKFATWWRGIKEKTVSCVRVSACTQEEWQWYQNEKKPGGRNPGESYDAPAYEQACKKAKAYGRLPYHAEYFYAWYKHLREEDIRLPWE